MGARPGAGIVFSSLRRLPSALPHGARPLPSVFNLETFNSLWDTWPKLQIGLTWPQIVQRVGMPRPVLAKGDKIGDPVVEMFTAAEHTPGLPIGEKNGAGAPVIGAHLGIWDFDLVHTDVLQAALQGLEAENLSYIYATTFSHGQPASEKPAKKHPKTCVFCGAGMLVRPATGLGTTWRCDHCTRTWSTACARIVLPFSRMVRPGDEWDTVWEGVNRHLFKGRADEACKPIGHRFFVPSYKEGAGAPPEYRITSGGELEVDRLLAMVGVARRSAGTTSSTRSENTLSRDALRRIAKVLTNNPAKKQFGGALFAVIKGDAYADSGERTPTTFRLVCEIVDRHPLVDPAAVSAHFAPSIAAMQPTKVTLEKIEEMVRQKAREPRADHTTRIAEAFAGSKTDAYSEAELAAEAEALGLRRDELRRRWIIQCGSSFYVLCAGRYWRYGVESVLNAVVRDLAPAISAGVDLTIDGGKSVRRKTIGELMEEYGAVADNVVVDLSAQRSHYDNLTRTFIEAPCPIRVTAEYDPEVEEWLRLLAGPLADKLNEWLACTARLDEPCAALYLEGGPGTGKSLLAHALARMYTTDRPADLGVALGLYNDDLIRCPIVLSDEQVPKDVRGVIRTDALREFIQARSRTLNRKYQPTATIRGSARVILASNNKNMLNNSEHLTENDIAAIAERFLLIEAQPEARKYLLDRQDRIASWVNDDKVAKHVKWLCENLEVTRSGRFLVSGETQVLTNSLATGTGRRADVCQWVMNLLLTPQVILNRPGFAGLIRARDGKLLLNARILAEAWTEYVPEKGTPPSPSTISRALAGLSTEVTIREPDGNRKMRVFDLERLAVWAEDTGYSDLERIRKLVVELEKRLSRPMVSTAN